MQPSDWPGFSKLSDDCQSKTIIIDNDAAQNDHYQSYCTAIWLISDRF
jgi:hypothetical protein